MNGADVFPQLQLNPVGVLTYTCVTIAGAADDGIIQVEAVPDGNGRSNPRPGRVLGRLRTTDEVAFTIRPAWPGAAHTMMAYSTCMQGHDNVNHPNYVVGNITGHYLPNMGGPSLMFTGQLSGCTFVILPQPAGVMVAHLEPDTPNGVNGATLQIDVDANLRFVDPAGAGHLNVAGVGLTTYGRGHGYGAAMRAAVIGVRIGGAWQFWGQSYDNGTKQIHQVRRIY